MRVALDPPAAPVRSALAACPVLAGLAPEVMSALAGRSRWRELTAGGVLFGAGDPADAVFVVACGSVVARVVTERGAVADLSVARPPELIGHVDVMAGDVRSCHAVAVEPATVVVIPAPAVEEMLHASPATLRALAADLARIVRLQCDAAARTLDTAPVRLATLLLDIARGADRVDFDGPQTLLAQRIGVTRQTFNRALHALADRGLVELVPGGRAVTLDHKRLDAFVRLHPFGSAALSSW